MTEVPIDQLMRAGEKVRAEEMVLSVADGRSVAVLINGSPIRSEDGEVESLIVTMQDMTPLKEAERLRAEVPGDGEPRAAHPPGHRQGLGGGVAGRTLRSPSR